MKIYRQVRFWGNGVYKGNKVHKRRSIAVFEFCALSFVLCALSFTFCVLQGLSNFIYQSSVTIFSLISLHRKPGINCEILNKDLKRITMAKSQDAKKSEKKAPLKTAKEKKAEKREKKANKG